MPAIAALGRRTDGPVAAVGDRQAGGSHLHHGPRTAIEDRCRCLLSGPCGRRQSRGPRADTGHLIENREVRLPNGRLPILGDQPVRDRALRRSCSGDPRQHDGKCRDDAGNGCHVVPAQAPWRGAIERISQRKGPVGALAAGADADRVTWRSRHRPSLATTGATLSTVTLAPLAARRHRSRMRRAEVRALTTTRRLRRQAIPSTLTSAGSRACP